MRTRHTGTPRPLTGGKDKGQEDEDEDEDKVKQQEDEDKDEDKGKDKVVVGVRDDESNKDNNAEGNDDKPGTRGGQEGQNRGDTFNPPLSHCST